MAPKTQKELAQLVVDSIAAIEALPKGGNTHMFVKAERVARRRTIDPTEHQQNLLNWIRKRGFVRWELTLGMHWGMLGGLMARGLVVEARQNGNRGIIAL